MVEILIIIGALGYAFITNTATVNVAGSAVMKAKQKLTPVTAVMYQGPISAGDGSHPGDLRIAKSYDELKYQLETYGGDVVDEWYRTHTEYIDARHFAIAKLGAPPDGFWDQVAWVWDKIGDKIGGAIDDAVDFVEDIF